MNQPNPAITAPVRIAATENASGCMPSVLRQVLAEEEEHTPVTPAANEVSLANDVRPVRVVAVLHQGIEDGVADSRQILVELVLQFGESDHLASPRPALQKSRSASSNSCGLAPRPFRGLLVEVKNIFFVGIQAHQVRVFASLRCQRIRARQDRRWWR